MSRRRPRRQEGGGSDRAALRRAVLSSTSHTRVSTSPGFPVRNLAGTTVLEGTRASPPSIALWLRASVVCTAHSHLPHLRRQTPPGRQRTVGAHSEPRVKRRRSPCQ